VQSCPAASCPALAVVEWQLAPVSHANTCSHVTGYCQ
jgi:hypothetical protein